MAFGQIGALLMVRAAISGPPGWYNGAKSLISEPTAVRSNRSLAGGAVGLERSFKDAVYIVKCTIRCCQSDRAVTSSSIQEKSEY